MSTGTVVSDASHYARSMAEPTSYRHEPPRGRHLAERNKSPYWVVTLVAEADPEEHIRNLMETVAMLAAVKGEDGIPLARSRTTQRQLMKRGIAVTVE